MGVVLNVPYPDSFAQANFNQIIPFSVCFFLALLFTANIFLKNILQSFSLALGLFFLLVLKALDSLNLVTGTLTLTATGLLFSYFHKGKKNNLTKQSKIPRLTKLSKQK